MELRAGRNSEDVRIILQLWFVCKGLNRRLLMMGTCVQVCVVAWNSAAYFVRVNNEGRVQGIAVSVRRRTLSQKTLMRLFKLLQAWPRRLRWSLNLCEFSYSLASTSPSQRNKEIGEQTFWACSALMLTSYELSASNIANAYEERYVPVRWFA